MTAPANAVYATGTGTVNGDNLNTFTQQCATVVAARAFTGTVGMGMWLQGTSAPNDGGQGPFYWNATSTASDDGGATVIAPTGSTVGRWLRQTLGSGSGAFTNLSVSGTLTLATNTTLTSDSTTVTLAGQLKTTGLTTVSDLAISGTKLASNVLAGPSGSTGTPTWRQLSNADISGLGSMATQSSTAVSISGGTLLGVSMNTNQDVTIGNSFAPSMTLGSSGNQGFLYLMSSAIGVSTLAVYYNGSQSNNLVFGSTSGARTYNVYDPISSNSNFLLTSLSVGGGNGLFGGTRFSLESCHNADGSAMSITPSSGKFGLSLTAGTSLFLVTETANSSTVTDSFSVESPLPVTFIPSSNVNVVVNANYVLGSGTIGTHTLQISLYSLTDAGVMTLVGSQTNTLTASAADQVFNFPTALSPNGRIMIIGQMIIQDTGGHAITGQINSIRLS